MYNYGDSSLIGKAGVSMKQLRKWLSFVFILLLFFTGVSLKAEAKSFADVPSTHWAAKEIDYLSDLGILKGGTNGLFNKEALVTRAEAAAILVRAKGLSTENVTDPGFNDVPESHFFYKEIAAAVNAGWFQSGANFNPNGQLKRVDMAKITNLAFDINGTVPAEWKDVSPSYHGAPHINSLLANGITTGYTAIEFNPSAYVTRAQMAVFTARAMNPEYRVKVISYPKKAAVDIYYPQFKDTTGANDFNVLNEIFIDEGRSRVQHRQELMEMALDDEMMGEYYTYEVSYRIPRADLNYISVLYASYDYVGGAHGYEQLFSFNYDVKNNSIISLTDLATKPGYEQRVVNRINEMNSEYTYYFGGPENLDELQYQFYLTPSSFVMYLNPYEYAPYAAGIREFSMPYSYIR